MMNSQPAELQLVDVLSAIGWSMAASVDRKVSVSKDSVGDLAISFGRGCAILSAGNSRVVS